MAGINLLTNSGGSTKFVAEAVANKIAVTEKGFIPDVIGGISAGTIQAIVTALGTVHKEIFDVAIEHGLNISIPQIFPKKRPVTKKGKIHPLAVGRVVFGDNSLGKQDISDLLKGVITKKLYDEYLKGDYPEVVVVAVAPKDMSVKTWYLKRDKVPYEMLYHVISASAHIPGYAQPVYIDGIGYVDGGLRHHNPSPVLLGHYWGKIKSHVSVFARPDVDTLPVKINWDKNFISVLSRILEGLSFATSLADEKDERDYAREHNNELRQLFMPGFILESQYDTNKLRLKELHDESIKATYAQWDIDRIKEFEYKDSDKFLRIKKYKDNA